MSDETNCAALAAAMEKKGWNHNQVAQAIGKPESYVADVFHGKTKPTTEEFNNITKVLGITAEPPHDGAHATK
ncbi:DNA-binding protein helix turn-helix [Ceratobasidium sp. AG-Ba]|nr:DNA-binding protein helix turn-helix [Ceratobasidium sp. AG-Ba]QRW09054.1 DNA-binding protein helix turn-helix [Ceratobasidium sp. AG-Ba]